MNKTNFNLFPLLLVIIITLIFMPIMSCSNLVSSDENENSNSDDDDDDDDDDDNNNDNDNDNDNGDDDDDNDDNDNNDDNDTGDDDDDNDDTGDDDDDNDDTGDDDDDDTTEICDDISICWGDEENPGCYECATSNGGGCAQLQSDCENDDDCLAVMECTANCPDTDEWWDCFQQCVSENPTGESGLTAIWDCVYCDACPTACAESQHECGDDDDDTGDDDDDTGDDDDDTGDDDDDDTGSDETLSSIIDKATFEAFFPDRNPFYTYEGFIEGAKAYPNFANDGDIDTRKREVAAFLANVARETGYLQYVEQIAQDVYCAPRENCSCAANKKYYGRGPLQISWNYNYCLAGDELGRDLRSNPDVVAQEPDLAWATALWFWMTQSGAGYMTCHEAIINENSFGETIRTINGGQECGGGWPDAVEERIKAFRDLCTILGIDTGGELYC